MTDQIAMQMGLGEPREATKWENIKVALKTRTKAIAGRMRASRLLRATLVLATLGGVFASGWVSSQNITAPGKLCECPLKIETPTAGKAKPKLEPKK